MRKMLSLLLIMILGINCNNKQESANIPAINNKNTTYIIKDTVYLMRERNVNAPLGGWPVTTNYKYENYNGMRYMIITCLSSTNNGYSVSVSTESINLTKDSLECLVLRNRLKK